MTRRPIHKARIHKLTTEVPVRWDQTGKVWHTDVSAVGRYSIRRLGKRQPWAAYLNGKQIANIEPIRDLEHLKHQIETRIITSFRIAFRDEAAE